MVRWVNTLSFLTCQPSALISEWLTKPYVLTQSIRKICQDFTVNVISQQFADPLPDEKQKLCIQDDEQSLIREVFLQGDGVPLTYGRVIIPQSTYHANAAALDALGTKPIGEALLYNHPESSRSQFEYAMLKEDSDLGRLLFPKLPTLVPQPLWCRRSVFWLCYEPLLVTEYFLPTLPVYPQA